MIPRTKVCGVLPLALALASIPAVGTAQARPEPRLLLTIFGGVTGGATLVTGLRQRVARSEEPTAVDTFELGRRLSPAITLGASTTYFPTPHIGLSAEIAFLGLGRDDTCQIVYDDPAVLDLGYNSQMCDDIASKGAAATTIAFYLGALFRIAPRGALKPYVRAQAGFTTRNSSTVELSGRYLDAASVVRDRVLILDPDPGDFNPSASFGAGFMLQFAPGYQARLELRDHLLLADRVTGPANALAIAPIARKLEHSPSLVLTLDIVLERKRGRRY